MNSDTIQDNKLQILGKFSAGLVHEIRNPLSAVILDLEYLHMIRNDLPFDAVQSVKSCLDAVNRIQHLIDSLSNFSRKHYIGDNKCSIQEVTNRAIEIAKGYLLTAGIKHQIIIHDNLPNIFFDKNKLLQIFLNLITNAAEACLEKGELVITVYNDSGTVIWSIRDNGIGIKPYDKDKIFKDFYTSKNKGTGLGLSVCKLLLEEHKSDIRFESRENEGTTFYISFNPNLLQE